MVMYNVTLKTNGSAEEIEKAKEEAKENGGAIRHEYKIIKGFVVEYPDNHDNVLKSNEHINVEQDGPSESGKK